MSEPGVTKDRSGDIVSAKFAFNGMNFLVDPADIDIETGICTDICNCDVDYKMNANRRQGFTLVCSGSVTSAWSNGTVAYCVESYTLYSFDGLALTAVTDAPSMSADVEFVQVNDVVVCSDGTNIGVIDSGTYYSLDKATDWIDVDQLETWVADHYPSDPANSSSNFTIDTFKLATLAGKCLEHHNGVLYLAIDNFVYATKTYDIASMDIRYNIVAGFPDEVTMIARVNDGLYVGTTTHVYFLQGTGFIQEGAQVTHNYKQTTISSYGVIPGSMQKVNGTLVPSVQTEDVVVLFTTPIGVYAASEGGKYVNLSDKQITITTGDKACSLFRDNNGVYQYMVCFNMDVFYGTLKWEIANSSETSDLSTEDNYLIMLDA